MAGPYFSNEMQDTIVNLISETPFSVEFQGGDAATFKNEDTVFRAISDGEAVAYAIGLRDAFDKASSEYSRGYDSAIRGEKLEGNENEDFTKGFEAGVSRVLEIIEKAFADYLGDEMQPIPGSIFQVQAFNYKGFHHGVCGLDADHDPAMIPRDWDLAYIRGKSNGEELKSSALREEQSKRLSKYGKSDNYAQGFRHGVLQSPMLEVGPHYNIGYLDGEKQLPFKAENELPQIEAWNEFRLKVPAESALKAILEAIKKTSKAMREFGASVTQLKHVPDGVFTENKAAIDPPNVEKEQFPAGGTATEDDGPEACEYDGHCGSVLEVEALPQDIRTGIPFSFPGIDATNEMIERLKGKLIEANRRNRELRLKTEKPDIYELRKWAYEVTGGQEYIAEAAIEYVMNGVGSKSEERPHPIEASRPQPSLAERAITELRDTGFSLGYNRDKSQWVLKTYRGKIICKGTLEDCIESMEDLPF